MFDASFEGRVLKLPETSAVQATSRLGVLHPPREVTSQPQHPARCLSGRQAKKFIALNPFAGLSNRVMHGVRHACTHERGPGALKKGCLPSLFIMIAIQ